MAVIIFLLTIFANISFIKLSQGSGHDGSTMLDLIHRDDLSGVPRTRLERLAQRLRSDEIRMQRILSSSKYHYNTSTIGSMKTGGQSGVTPISSGYDYGTAEYFVKIMVGTPPQEFTVVADTGSDLTWVMCSMKKNGAKGIFVAGRSSSFKTIPCSSQMCRKDLVDLSANKCPPRSPAASCGYDYSYGVGSTKGIFAKETVALTQNGKQMSAFPNVLIGCSNSMKDLDNGLAGADGIMGLGYSEFSLPAQASSKLLENEFSYCLVDSQSHRTVSSKLILGSRRGTPKTTTKMQYTSLVSGLPPYYGVDIKGIRVGGKILSNIPPDTWKFEKGGGAFIDSGTSLTYLPKEAYGPVVDALSKPVLKFKKRAVDGFGFCFALPNGLSVSKLMPILEFVFKNGAIFKPDVKGYVVDAVGAKKCLGFALVKPSPNLAVIGNMMQQNHLWEFALDSGQVGFAPSRCT